MTKNVIQLSARKDQISFSEIPWLIAKAITPPELANTEKITTILKRHIPAGMPYDEETIHEIIPLNNLTDNDWSVLNLAFGFADLPPLRQGKNLIDINLSDWEPYEKAMKEYKPEWQLVARSSTNLNIIANKHWAYLKDAILKNKVVVYDHLTHIPLQLPIDLFALEKAYMTVCDFKKYAENFNLTVLVGNATGAENILQKITAATQQDNAILNWLIKNKYNPKALPIPPKGKSGVKKLCRDELCEKFKLFSSISVFDTAWDRLRKNKEIQDEKLPPSLTTLL
jgi:hypothetical protein